MLIVEEQMQKNKFLISVQTHSDVKEYGFRIPYFVLLITDSGLGNNKSSTQICVLMIDCLMINYYRL